MVDVQSEFTAELSPNSPIRGPAPFLAELRANSLRPNCPEDFVPPAVSSNVLQVEQP